MNKRRSKNKKKLGKTPKVIIGLGIVGAIAAVNYVRKK